MKTPTWRVFPASGKSTNWFEVSFPGLTKNYFTWSLFIRFFLMPPKSFKPDSSTDDTEIELTPPKKAKTIKSSFLLLETMRGGFHLLCNLRPSNWKKLSPSNRPQSIGGIFWIQPGLGIPWGGWRAHLAAPFVPSFIISLMACSRFFTHFICQIAPFLEWTQCVSYYHSPTDLRNCRIPISSLCFCVRGL